MSVSVHRKIWIKHNGPIPRDDRGQSYDIHHINGDHSDNRPENLQCVTKNQHYHIHLMRGDMMACCIIRGRMKLPIEFTKKQKERLRAEAKAAAQLRVKKGTHNFVKNNPNYQIGKNGKRELVLNCVDRRGKSVRIPKSEYVKQKGDMRKWKYVSVSSNEARRRQFALQ